MNEIRRGRVRVKVPDEMLDYPGHRRELMEKIEELNALIFSVETGAPLPWL